MDLVCGEGETVSRIEADSLLGLGEGGAVKLYVDPEDRSPASVQNSIVGVGSPKSVILDCEATLGQLFLLPLKTFFSQGSE
jgi:hypothetical protein